MTENNDHKALITASTAYTHQLYIYIYIYIVYIYMYIYMYIYTCIYTVGTKKPAPYYSGEQEVLSSLITSRKQVSKVAV
jgi:hypothetical protein